MIKVGIIGCGTIANSAHIPSYVQLPNVEVKYFCDIIQSRAEDAVKKYGCATAVTDYKEVLADKEITAISICTPNNSHAQIAIDAMQAGKHVLCEKPAARTYTEALEMQKVQKETGKILNIGVVNRFNAAVNLIKKHIEDGKLGTVYHIYASFRAHRSIPGLGGDFTNSAVAGGGVLIDWGVHFLDLVMYCVDDPIPLTVSAEIFKKLGVDMKNYVYTSMWAGPPKYDGVYDVEDSVTALIRTKGPVISLNGAWAENINSGGMFVDFMGDKAGVRLTYGGDFTVYTTENGALTEYQPEFDKTDMYLEEIKSFVNCITTSQNNKAHIDTVIITAQIMQAIYDSAAKGAEIVFK